MDQKVVYAFGPFRLETKSQLLSFENKSINLQPKIYHLLLYFLRHPDRLISHEELFETVWQGRIVEDSSLRLAINTLRKALHDDSKSPRYILTVCKRGYRFLPNVTVENGLLGNSTCAELLGYDIFPRSELPSQTPNYENELEHLVEYFEQASRGKRCMVFLKGERGIGKTAVLERFLASVSHPDVTMIHARCVQLEVTLEPFLPLLEALEIRWREFCTCNKALIDCLRLVAPTWLYQMSNHLEPEELAELYPKFSQFNTARMLREGVQFFEKLGTESICILILDDSQWSDLCTLDLINFLASRHSPTKLLMILCYRPDENSACVKRIEAMREELQYRGLCQELLLR